MKTVVHSCSSRTKRMRPAGYGSDWWWCRERRTGDSMFRSVDSDKTSEIELVEVK